MFDITNHQGNANKNHSEIPSYQLRIVIIKKKLHEDVERELSLLVGILVNIAIMYNYMEVPQNQPM